MHAVSVALHAWSRNARSATQANKYCESVSGEGAKAASGLEPLQNVMGLLREKKATDAAT
jgi:hypothetical protein